MKVILMFLAAVSLSIAVSVDYDKAAASVDKEKASDSVDKQKMRETVSF